MDEVDHLYLDRASRQLLLRWLRDFAWLARELEVVTRRATRYGARSERPSSSTPVVFNTAASDLAHEVRDVCMSWMTLVCEVRHVPRPHPSEWTAAGLAGWLADHVVDLAQVEPAFDCLEEMRELHARALRMIDRPEEMEFVGPCQSETPGVECDGVYARRGSDTRSCSECGVCVDVPAVMEATRARLEETLFTESELVAALRVALGRTIPRQTIHSWVTSGRLTDRSGRFKLADAVALGESYKPKRRQKQARPRPRVVARRRADGQEA